MYNKLKVVCEFIKLIEKIVELIMQLNKKHQTKAIQKSVKAIE